MSEGSIVKDETWELGAWTAMPDEIVRDRALSLDAKGLIWYIASHSGSFVIRLEQLRLQVGVGRQKLLKLLRELEAAGYLKREKTRQEVGGVNRQGPSRYLLSRSRQTAGSQTSEFQQAENRTPETVGVSAGQTQGADSQGADFQQAGKSTTLKNTKLKNIPPPSGGVQGGKPEARGTRLPEDWQPTLEMIKWCRSEFPNLDGRTATENFIDYWLSKAGADARKVDWARTWKRWIRTEAGRQASRGRPSRVKTVVIDGVTYER